MGLSSSLWGEKQKFLPFKGCASKPLCWISCRPGILIYWQKYLFDIWMKYSSTILQIILIYWKKYLFGIWMKYFSTILQRILIYWKISHSLTSNETLLCQVPKKKRYFRGNSDLLPKFLTFHLLPASDFTNISSDKIDNMTTLWQLLWLNIIQRVNFDGCTSLLLFAKNGDISIKIHSSQCRNLVGWIIYWRTPPLRISICCCEPNR